MSFAAFALAFGALASRLFAPLLAAGGGRFFSGVGTFLRGTGSGSGAAFLLAGLGARLGDVACERGRVRGVSGVVPIYW